MIQSTKRCVRKTIGKVQLTYELSTVLAKVEMILNSRPLSYIESDDHEQPLTPSHLIMGRRVMNLKSISVEKTPAPPLLTSLVLQLANQILV